MSGGDLSTLQDLHRETELPLISINTGENRLSYPKVDYSKKPADNYNMMMMVSPYQQEESPDDFMPLDMFQKVIQETESLIHKNNEDPAEYQQA